MITSLDLFELIGRQAVQIDLLKKENEQLKAMLQQAQNGITEAQEIAKKLHQQTQKSAIENNGALEEKKREVDYSMK